MPEWCKRLYLMTAGKGSGEVKVRMPRLKMDLYLDSV